MLRQTAMAGAYSVARKTGIDRALRNSSWRTRRLLILCWHGISIDDEHLWNPTLFVSPRLFRERLQALEKGRYNVLSLNEAIERWEANDLPPRSVVITFDDGFYDFAVHAAPILADFGFPATVYLTTYYVDHPLPIFNLAVQYMLWKTGTPEASRRCSEINAAVPAGANGPQRNEIAHQVADELGFDYGSLLERRLLQIMNPSEVSALAQSGSITFEAHTHRHRSPPDLNLMRRELNQNNDRIEQMTGRRPVHFCYPSGIYRREHFPLFEEAGFKSATTCELGLVARNDARYLLPRLLDAETLSALQYEGWLSGAYAVARRR